MARCRHGRRRALRHLTVFPPDDQRYSPDPRITRCPGPPGRRPRGRPATLPAPLRPGPPRARQHREYIRTRGSPGRYATTSPPASGLCRSPPSLHRREGGGTQDGGGHLLHDGTVLFALGEDAGALRILGERVELGHALVEALPGQQVDELVVVATHAVQPVANLPEAVLLEGVAREAAESLSDVGDLLGHGLVFAQLEEIRAAGGGVRSVGLAPVELGIRRRLHELVLDAVDQDLSFSTSAHFLPRSGSARQAAFFFVRSSWLSQPQM